MPLPRSIVLRVSSYWEESIDYPGFCPYGGFHAIPQNVLTGKFQISQANPDPGFAQDKDLDNIFEGDCYRRRLDYCDQEQESPRRPHLRIYLRG